MIYPIGTREMEYTTNKMYTKNTGETDMNTIAFFIGILLFEIYNFIYAKGSHKKVFIGILMGILLFILSLFLCN